MLDCNKLKIYHMNICNQSVHHESAGAYVERNEGLVDIFSLAQYK